MLFMPHPISHVAVCPQEKGHTDAVTAVCWAERGSKLYSSSLDGHVVEWEVAASKLKE
jgi:hypothetical protein